MASAARHHASTAITASCSFFETVEINVINADVAKAVELRPHAIPTGDHVVVIRELVWPDGLTGLLARLHYGNSNIARWIGRRF